MSGLLFPKPATRAEVKAQRERLERAVEAAAREHVLAREGGLCRRCGQRGEHVHHLLYRSKGGRWETSDLVLLCAACHEAVHRKRLNVEWSDANEPGGVTFLVA